MAWAPELEPDLMYSFVGIDVGLSEVELEDNTTDLFSAEIRKKEYMFTRLHIL